MRLTSGPVTIEVRSVGARDVAGAAADRSLVFRRAYPKADSFFVAEPQRVEEFIVLSDARAPRAYEYQVKVVRGGGRVRQLAGVVEALDGEGIAWLRLARPYLIDAAGERHEVTSVLVGERLSVRVPVRADSYPLLLDPGWTTTGGMIGARRYHTATRLSNGKVLVVGAASPDTELYDLGTDTWTATGSVTATRWRHTATRLPSGKVLITGGAETGAYLYHPGAELYDPGSGAWAATAGMSTNRVGHTATLLSTGEVLVAGGETCSTVGLCSRLSSAELYAPITGTWKTSGSLTAARMLHTATRLSSGKVLVTGGTGGAAGHLSSAELYDPATGKWTPTGSMAAKRSWHTATLLASGKVLVAGKVNAASQVPSAELYDPASGMWSKTGSMAAAQLMEHTATLLASGEVLVTGGQVSGPALSSAERYDPPKGTWSSASDMLAKRRDHTATLLASGKVLVVGGQGIGVATSAELYDPTSALACKAAKDCASGFCVDGICCESACMGACKRCVDQSGPQGSFGKCVVVAKGKSDPVATSPCTGARACDGSGKCVIYLGQVCTSGSQCVTGYCVDGVCCDAACAGTCRSCALPAKLSVCSLVPSGQHDSSATTPCAGTSACDGKGACKTAAGKACAAASECITGFCVDSVCCGSLCSETCKSCALTGIEGTCSFVTAGKEDPSAKVPCTGGQVCDGSGGCKKTAGKSCTTSGECGTGICADGYCCDSTCAQVCKRCDLAGSVGTCSFVAAGKTDPGGSPACKSPNACDGAGGCKKGSGQACSASSECSSGFCADGYCCDAACTQTCKACNLSGSVGKCKDVAAGKPDASASSPCSGASACDGAGACKKGNGQVCGAASQCGSGFCSDGYCCDTPCTETCKACSLSGKAGACGYIPAGQTDTVAGSPCSKNRSCDGKGGCKLDKGETCKKGSECLSDHCKDGYCCDTACDKTCESCAVAGAKGSCTPIPSNTNPDKECLGVDTTCGGMCNGKGQCDFPGIGKGCGTCKACDGTGKCASTPPDDKSCGVIDCDKLDSKCRDFQDLTAERCASFGSCKAANDAKGCVRYTELCGDSGVQHDAKAARDTGPQKEAGPRADRGAAPVAADDSGCGCAAAGPSDAAWLMLLLGLALSLRRRRGQP